MVASKGTSPGEGIKHPLGLDVPLFKNVIIARDTPKLLPNVKPLDWAVMTSERLLGAPLRPLGAKLQRFQRLRTEKEGVHKVRVLEYPSTQGFWEIPRPSRTEHLVSPRLEGGEDCRQSYRPCQRPSAMADGRRRREHHSSPTIGHTESARPENRRCTRASPLAPPAATSCLGRSCTTPA